LNIEKKLKIKYKEKYRITEGIRMKKSGRNKNKK